MASIRGRDATLLLIGRVAWTTERGCPPMDARLPAGLQTTDQHVSWIVDAASFLNRTFGVTILLTGLDDAIVGRYHEAPRVLELRIGGQLCDKAWLIAQLLEHFGVDPATFRCTRDARPQLRLVRSRGSV